MQAKVSIVMPCYNKAPYIATMFDSVIAQKWNNIELILVNDGSTDGTREIIADYEHKFKSRGFDLKIIDQENGGCCKAVHTGLLNVGGDYMCLIDADDELDPEYVSTMAKWLEEHQEYDYCTCEYLTIRQDQNKQFYKTHNRFVWPKDSYTPEFFLCNDPNKAAWAFLTRMSYIKKCQLIEMFYTDTRGSYEPSFFIPFCVHNGKMKHFNLPLYYYNHYADGLSKSATMAGKDSYWREYHRVILIMLSKMQTNALDKYKRKYFEALSAFYTIKQLLQTSQHVNGGKTKQEELRQNFLIYTNNWLSLDPPLTYEDICENTQAVIRAAELALSGIGTIVPQGRIIGYGVLGKSAARYLPMIEGTKLQPTELWDKGGDGVKVLLPETNIGALTDKDIVIIFPTALAAVKEIEKQFENCPAKLLFPKNLLDYLAQEQFPQFAKI